MEAGAQEVRGGALLGRRPPPVDEVGAVVGARDAQVEPGAARVLQHDLAGAAPRAAREELPATYLERRPVRLHADMEGGVQRVAGAEFTGSALLDQARHPVRRALERHALARGLERSLDHSSPPTSCRAARRSEATARATSYACIRSSPVACAAKRSPMWARAARAMRAPSAGWSSR